MARLGEYLGHLLTEVTMARVQGDLEAVRVAEMYSSHPLLKHLPVPHFRLPAIEFDMPVAIGDVETIDASDDPRAHWDPTAMAAQFAKIVDTVLEKRGNDLRPDERSSVIALVQERIEFFKDHPREVAGSLTGIIQEMIVLALEPLKKRKPEEQLSAEKLQAVRRELQERVMVAYLKLRAQPPRLNAAVGAGEIKEEARDLLAKIKMKLVEEGMEWTEVEDGDGNPSMRLVTE